MHIGDVWIRVAPYWAWGFRPGQAGLHLFLAEWWASHNCELTSTNFSVAVVGLGLWLEIDWYHQQEAAE